MPDWSYHPLKKFFLDHISPRSSRAFIHKSMNTLASIPGGRILIHFLGHMKPPQQLSKEISNISFPAPIGLSSLIDPHAAGTKAFQQLGFGFIEIGPVVLKDPKKQHAPTMLQQHILFSQQQEKLPLGAALHTLLQLHKQIPILARIDPDITSSEREIILQQLTPYVDAFIINKQYLEEMLHSDRLCSASANIVDTDTQTLTNPVLRPIYGAILAEELDIAGLQPFIDSCGVDGIVIEAPRHRISNDWHENEAATEQLADIVNQVKAQHPTLTVITSGGVNCPQDAYALVQAGADLLMLTEGYVAAGPGLPKRSYERLLYEEDPPTTQNYWHWSLLFGLSIFIGGLLALYFAFTSIILPYDEAFIGLTREQLLQINPRILSFMSHDRMALAGTMLSGGILYIQLARHGLRYGLHWAKIAYQSAAIIGFLGILLFIGYGYFDWLHGLFWLILLPIFVLSCKEGKTATHPPFSRHESNDKSWQLANYGQLMFVILGFALIIGGIVISTIGVSRVFIATDISYLCMPAEAIADINSHLIPVIAHDRAGFGSALISVGLLVTMLSLWGFRKGARWVWNTLAVGALPAFIAGIGTHFYIGYTTFIHLLPVYFLVVCYGFGLILSYRYLKK